MAHISFNTTRNSISDEVTYNATTGGKITKPQNINGQLECFGMLMFNSSIDSAGYFNVNTFTTLNYKNQVAYLYQQQLLASTENTTRSTSVSERLSVSYRNDWIEIEPNGSVDLPTPVMICKAQEIWIIGKFFYGMNLTLYAP